MKLLTALAFATVMIPARLTAGGWALSSYWRWFILPVWPGLDPLSLGQGIGLSFFVGLVTKKSSHLILDESSEDHRKRSVIYLLTVLFSVGIGWLVQAVIY